MTEEERARDEQQFWDKAFCAALGVVPARSWDGYEDDMAILRAWVSASEYLADAALFARRVRIKETPPND